MKIKNKLIWYLFFLVIIYTFFQSITGCTSGQHMSDYEDTTNKELCKENQDCLKGFVCARSEYTKKTHCYDIAKTRKTEGAECQFTTECDFGMACIEIKQHKKECQPFHKKSIENKLKCLADHDCEITQVCIKSKFGDKICKEKSEVLDPSGDLKCLAKHDCEFNQVCVNGKFGYKVCKDESEVKNKKCFHDHECSFDQVCAKNKFSAEKTCQKKSNVMDSFGNKKCNIDTDCEFNEKCEQLKCVEKKPSRFGSGKCEWKFGKQVCSNDENKKCNTDFDCR